MMIRGPSSKATVVWTRGGLLFFVFLVLGHGKALAISVARQQYQSHSDMKIQRTEL